VPAGPDPRSALGHAANALKFWDTRQEVLSNNLANVNTAGFKGERVFARLLGEATLAADAGTDFSTGSMTRTERPLDLALETEGFFVVRTPSGDRLTRNGSFQIRDDVLTEASGNPVQGQRGNIEIPFGEMVITREGFVQVDGVRVDQIRVVQPTGELEHEAGSLFRTSGAPLREVPQEEVRVLQGALEESNVNPVSAMVEMLEVQRSHQSVERTIRALDDIMVTVTTRLGRLS
jgi:flagellar basal body rod protein FlgG